MNMKRLLASTLIVIVMMTIVASAISIPSTVRGYVSYKNGTLVNGVTVNVTQTDKVTGGITVGEVATDTDLGTGLNGFYSVSFDKESDGRNYSYVIRAKLGTFSNTTNIAPTSALDMAVNLTILPKGDVDGYAGITMADAMYIGKAVMNKPGFTLDTTTMDVDGQAGVTLNDALYLAKYVIGVPGFETLQ